jgi:hypothetical protein
MPPGAYVLAVAIAAAAIATTSSTMAQSYQRPSAPEIQDGRAWLDRKAAERERTFQGQQRQQADEWRELRLERRLDAEPAHGGGQTKVAWAVKGGTISGKAAVFFNRAQLGKLFLPVSLFG